MEACAAVALWTSVSLPDIAWRASAVWSGENGRRGWNLHSRFFQRIYPFPDTATKPARLRPSDKYMPCRMWHDAQARSGVGKTVTGDGPVRPILPANPSLFGYRHTARLIAPFRQVHAFPDVAWRASATWNGENRAQHERRDRPEIQPHSDAMHTNAIHPQIDRTRVLLNAISIGVCTPCERQITAAKDVPSLCAFGRWTIYDTPKRSNHAITAPPERFKPPTAFRFKKHRWEFCMPAARNRSRGWPPGFERFRGKSSAWSNAREISKALAQNAVEAAHLLRRKRRSISSSAQSRP